jgi:predicted RNA-binding Zn-ribbon protein involved in translation (DUF1610 family)
MVDMIFNCGGCGWRIEIKDKLPDKCPNCGVFHWVEKVEFHKEGK